LGDYTDLSEMMTKKYLMPSGNYRTSAGLSKSYYRSRNDRSEKAKFFFDVIRRFVDVAFKAFYP
jgi:hypothetical protein